MISLTGASFELFHLPHAQLLLSIWRLINFPKILYIYLLSVYNKHKKCSSVSLETIANNVNISLTTVKQSIKNLTRHGYMTVEKEMSNRGYINVYKNFKHLSIE